MNSELKQNSDVVLTKIEGILVIEVQLYVRMPECQESCVNGLGLAFINCVVEIIF